VQANERLLRELVSDSAVTGHGLTERNQPREVLAEALLEASLGHHHISLHVPAAPKVPSTAGERRRGDSAIARSDGP
jgi:hypothetical protein